LNATGNLPAILGQWQMTGDDGQVRANNPTTTLANQALGHWAKNSTFVKVARQ
jgi:hypothetical protein